MPGTAVVIPYFQREAGLLASAIRSALTQRDAGPVTVVVCDDGSPVPAAMDLAMLDLAERERVVLVRQANAGAGAARNAALDTVPPGTEWIAFLDSDDRWGPDHLARSVAALRAGHDLCFSDVRRDTEARTHFQGAAFRPDQHEPLDVLPGLYRFAGDFMAQNLAMSPVSISSVVMRADTLGDLRFPQMAVEDLMYWFEAARRGPRVAFDATLQVHYGSGDITLTESWKSPRELRNRLAYHRIFMRVWRGFALTPPQRAILRRRMAESRRAFCMGVLATLRDGRVPDWRVAAGFLALDPALLRTLAGRAAAVAVRRLVSRPAGMDGAAQTGR
jgi:succinoglycan biosynthesis protein ExoW